MRDVALAEDLLERVEREARELGFYEVRAVLRDLITGHFGVGEKVAVK